MQFLRSFGFVLTLIFVFVGTGLAQQVIDEVDIQGNRRLKDQDLLYYIKTRPGDVYDSAKIERDLRELLSFGWFDKTESRVLTEQGPRGGVNVIFEVKELPIIRELTFEGTKAIQESDILKAFREGRVGISKEAIYDPVKTRVAKRILREMLAAKGYPNAKVDVIDEEVSPTSVAVTFDIDQGRRSRIVEIDFEGNEVFKDKELRKQLQLVKEAGLISRFKGQDILELRKMDYDLRTNVLPYMRSKGYFQARIGEPEVVGLGYKRTGIPVLGILPIPMLSSKDDTLKVVVPISEGKVFRVGDVNVTGNSIFSEQTIQGILGLKKGDIADGKRLQTALYEDLKRIYGSQGFVEYDVELDPKLRDNPDNPEEGIADFDINIVEGKQYRLRRLEFTGNTFTRDNVLRREFLMNEGDIYNQQQLDISVARLNQLGYFDPIDKDQDVETRTDPEEGYVDSVLKVSERGRQQIQFNGGVSGIGGAFFGLTYSTNNLLGRGESLSLSFAAGNRQRSFQFSMQEPYFLDRPISVGFSVFGSDSKFFGAGTALSQNVDAINGYFDPYGTVTADEDTLFTQKRYGASVFMTAPLSEFLFKKRRFTSFARIGVSYQLSATSIEDPPVNESTDLSQRIPIIYSQPNITTSKITPTFVYDTRQYGEAGIDAIRGTQISASLGFAGLGGDVRTYNPQFSYTSFIPVRNRRSNNPDVFAFRVLANSIGSWKVRDKLLNSNSISYIDGIPIFERNFMGSEYDVRGYSVRSISPWVPYDTYLTTEDVSVATNFLGTPGTEITTIDDNGNTVTNTLVIPTAISDELVPLASYSGATGANPLLFRRSYQPIGGDTKFLGNFEYRMPIIGPVSIAAFADIGTVFNIHKSGTQEIDSEFLRDDLFVGSGTLTLTSLLANPNYESSFGAYLYEEANTRILTSTQFETDYCGGVRDDCPTTVPTGLTPLFLRGNVQQNSQLLVGDAVFDNFSDIRSSVGLELRIQVPVVNVPFRLIYFYNPNMPIGEVEGAPGLILPGKKSGFKFTVGRTF